MSADETFIKYVQARQQILSQNTGAVVYAQARHVALVEPITMGHLAVGLQEAAARISKEERIARGIE